MKVKLQTTLPKKRRTPRVQNPHPRDNCALCQRDISDPLMVGLWAAMALSSQRKRKSFQSELLLEHAADISMEEVQRHFATHRPPQPDPARHTVREVLHRMRLNQRDRDMVQLLSNMWLARPGHLRELFFTDSYTSDEASRAGSDRAFKRLAHLFVLHSATVPGQASKLGENYVVYGLGAAGAEWMKLRAEEEGLDGYRVAYQRRAEDVNLVHLDHDLGVLDILMDLRRTRGDVELAGRTVHTEMRWENFYASRRLGFRAQVPQYVDEFERMIAARERNLFADGFGVVGVSPDTGASFALPFILENDTGTRKLPVASEQIWKYLALAREGVVKQRFPELDVDGYDVPLVFVTKGAYGPGNRRIQSLKKLAREKAEKRTLKNRPPIFLVQRADVERYGLQAPALDLWGESDERTPLLRCLVRSSKELIRAGVLSADSVLALNASAGVPEKSLPEQVLSSGERQAAMDESERLEAERLSYQREWEAREAERRRRLDELSSGLSGDGSGGAA